MSLKINRLTIQPTSTAGWRIIDRLNNEEICHVKVYSSSKKNKEVAKKLLQIFEEELEGDVSNVTED